MCIVIVTTKAISGSFDDLMPPPERYIFNFNSKKELTKWHLYSDSEFGGALVFHSYHFLLLKFVPLVNLILGFLGFSLLFRVILCISTDT